MRRYALFAILSIITALSLFITAATCSFCGIKLDTTPTETEITDAQKEDIDESSSTETMESSDTESGNEEETAEQAEEEDNETEIEDDDIDVVEFLREEASIQPDPDLSGIVYESGHTTSARDRMSISVGDTTSYIQCKGYISFNISELHGKTVVDSSIEFLNITIFNNPQSFATITDIKAFNYGNSLDAEDFNPGGTRLAQIPISSTSYTITGNTLKDQLQMALNETDRDFFQIKLGLDGETNNDLVGDAVSINLDHIYLYITYY
jgi:hypothetical protein